MSEEPESSGPDVASARMREADDLASRRLYREALEAYMWCFDEGHLRQPSFGGVRLSFLLGKVMELSRVYPLALEELDRRRVAAESRILGGEIGEWTLQELGALNDNLSDLDRTLRVFDKLLDRDDLGQAATLLRFVLPELIRAKRYDDVVRVAGDVHRMVSGEIHILEDLLEGIRGLPEKRFDEAEAVEYAKQSFIEEGADYYEALLGSGRRDEASRCADQLLAVHPVGSSFATMIRRAVRAGSITAARALADRGLQVLPAAAALIEAAAQIPPQPK